MPNRLPFARCALFLVASAIACSRDGGGGAARGSGSGDILVGAAWPWSERTDVLYGQGIDQAVAELNDAGGVLGRKLHIVREDDHESVNEGRVIAQRFAKQSGVVAVIGHLQSYVTIPAAAIYDQAGIVLISPTATAPELTSHGYGKVFRTVFTDRQVGGDLADVAAARGYGRVAIYYMRSDYGRALANAFEEEAGARHVRVVDRQSYDPSTNNIEQSAHEVATAWKALGIDAILVAGQVPQAATFIAEARRAGVDVPILGGDALGTPALMTVGGATVEGTVIATAFHADDPRPEIRGFTAEFKRRYGHAPDAAAALGYDAVRVLAEGIRQARSTDPQQISGALRRLHEWPAVTGRFSFDAKGDLVGSPVAHMVVRKGQFEFLNTTPLLSQREP
jgi:branched-chain amino acid transport system substrate-binding protein